MTQGAEEFELLFFDTFSHEASEEVNLDLVQFPKPVLIGEVRIIPLGARVQADFPGGVRLGATNPSQFKLEFFINDLSKPGASTFENLGVIEYNQNGNIRMECEQKVATDGLVLRGWYTTITLAVYGAPTNTTDQPAGQPVGHDTSQPSGHHPTSDWRHNQMREENYEGSHYTSYPAENYPPVDYPRYPWQPHHPHQECRSGYEARKPFEGEDGWETHDEKHWPKDRTDTPYSGGSEVSPEYGGERGTPEYDEATRREYYGWQGWGKRPRTPPPQALPPTPTKEEGVTETVSSSTSQLERLNPGDTESISEGDIPEEDGPQPFEPLSDDDLPEYPQFQEGGECDFNETSDEFVKVFDPYNYEVKPPKWFKEPKDEWVEMKEGSEEEAGLVLSSITSPSEDQLRWVEACEQLVHHLPCSLPHSGDVDKLVDWCKYGLELEAALRHTEPGVKIRHVKVGVRLTEATFSLPTLLSTSQISSLQDALLNLYSKEHMALSVRLVIVRCLDVSVSTEEGMAELVRPAGRSKQSGYQRVLGLLQEKQLARLRYALSALLVKIHYYQLVHLLPSMVSELKEGKGQVEQLCLALGELTREYKAGGRGMAQPRRFLPASALFELPNLTPDPRLSLYTFMKAADTLNTLTCLLSTEPPGHLVGLTLSFLSCLADTHHGLRFLAHHPHINTLLRKILSIDRSLGIGLVYRLKTLACLEELVGVEADSATTLDSLHELFCLVGDARGRAAVVAVLALGDNLTILLDLLHMPARRRSPTRGYILDILTFVLKFSPDISYLDKISSRLHSLVSDNESAELTNWLKPVPNGVLSYDTVDYLRLYDCIKENMDNCVSLPESLVMAIRVWKHLGVSQEPIEYPSDFTELKYKYVVLKLYSLGGLADLISILQKITEAYEHPAFHSGTLIGCKGAALMELVLPAVQLVRRMLTYVIRSQNCEFKDVSAVKVLVNVYKLVMCLGSRAEGKRAGEEAAGEVVQALLAYTQPDGVQALNKSVWTLMLKEVTRWSLDLPMNYLHGVTLLSQLLPLPLPIQTIKPLTEHHINKMVNWRKLWAAHVHSGCVVDVVAALCVSSHKPLVKALHRLCLQLTDLAAPVAVAVVTSLLDRALPTPGLVLPFLSSLATHPAVKAGVLHVLGQQSYCARFTALLSEAGSVPGLLPLVQALCDVEICLSGPPSDVPSDTYLANALPPKALLAPVCSALADLTSTLADLTSAPRSTSTLISVLRIFGVLLEHDYGFFYVKQAMEGWVKKPCVTSLLRQCVASDSKELAVLTVGLGLALGSSQGFTLRRAALPPSTLRALFSFPDAQHPLHALAQKEFPDEDPVPHLKENIDTLMKLLSEETPSTQPSEGSEVVGEAEALVDQFASRPVVAQGGDPSSLSLQCWFSSPSLHPPLDIESDQVKVELGQLVKDLADWSECVSKVCNTGSGPALPSHAPHTTHPAHKPPFVAVMRGRGGGTASSGSTDAFRSRPPNTSRPPSLHVDDFVALETCGAQPTGPTGYNKLTMRAAHDLLGMRGGVGAGVRGRPPVERNARFFGQPYMTHPPPHYQYYNF